MMFAYTTESPQGGWTAIGLGIRLAQDVGAHRKRLPDDKIPSAENELWKRAFWSTLSFFVVSTFFAQLFRSRVIFSIERIVCSFAGRSCGLQGEESDHMLNFLF